MTTNREQSAEPSEGIDVRTEFVRHRNVLLARANLSGLFIDYYLHLGETGKTIAPEHDQLFKQMLAAFVLHAASRPAREHIAWTISLQQPRINLFTTADNQLGTVVGRIFTEHVKEAPTNMFYQETVIGGRPLRRSVVDFEGTDLFAAVEKFYEISEQRPGRLFDLGDENYVLVSAHPDYDEAWFRGLTLDDVRSITGGDEILVPIERRRYRWHCGCNERRIFQVLTPAMQRDPDELFGGEPVIRVECPRCGVRYAVSREALEAYLAEQASEGASSEPPSETPPKDES